MTETRGDGTDLCCIVNPIRVHVCGRTFCKDHWWKQNRERQGLKSIGMPGYQEGTMCLGCFEHPQKWVHPDDEV